MDKLLTIVLATLVLAGCAFGRKSAEVPPGWKPAHPDFRFMSAYVGQRYIAMDRSWQPRTEDRGFIYVYDRYKLRNAPQPGMLEVVAMPPSCDEARASFEGNNRLVITCVTRDWDLRFTITPNAQGGFDELYETKRTAGLNLLRKYKFGHLYQTRPVSDQP